jgi:flavin reductase (DIM6/NTAB) family NADH-FMN oxidoreductase RutF
MSDTDNTYFYDPSTGHGLPHDPFKAIVAPRLIGWISTRAANGALNLAPYSFFGAFGSSPPIIGFCSEGRKDSIANIEATGEFVWNFTSRALAEQMPAAGRNVSVPHVAESPAALECRLLQVVRLHTIDGEPMNNWLALGQVVGVHIRNAYLKDGLFDTQAAQPVMRAGYVADYAQIGEKFQMIRPKA